MRRLLGDLSQNSFTPHSGTYQGVGWENLITSAALIALSKYKLSFQKAVFQQIRLGKSKLNKLFWVFQLGTFWGTFYLQKYS